MFVAAMLAPVLGSGAPAYPVNAYPAHEKCGGDEPPPETAPPVMTTSAPIPQTQAPVPQTQAPAPQTQAPPPPTYGANGPQNKVMQYIFEQTNLIRAYHGVQPLVWDNALAAGVQRGANRCPGFNHFTDNNAWQNLASGAPCENGSIDGNCIVKVNSEAWRWYREEEPQWDYQARNCTSPLGWDACGHFVIETSPEQRTIGCAMSACGYRGGTNVWCDYRGLQSKYPVIPQPQGSIEALHQQLQQHRQRFLAAY